MKTMHIAFVDGDIGLASTLGIVMLIIVCFIAVIQKTFEKKTEGN